MADEELIGTGAAAEAVGWTSRSLTRWVRAGKLTPARRSPGGRLYWSLPDLRRQLAELEGGHGDDASAQG